MKDRLPAILSLLQKHMFMHLLVPERVDVVVCQICRKIDLFPQGKLSEDHLNGMLPCLISSSNIGPS